MNGSNLADKQGVLSIKNYYYIIHFWYISKDDATNIMNVSNLADKQGVL